MARKIHEWDRPMTAVRRAKMAQDVRNRKPVDLIEFCQFLNEYARRASESTDPTPEREAKQKN